MPVAPTDPLPLGFTAAEILAFAAGPLEADLAWPNGDKTRVRYQMSEPEIFLVDSEPDPEFRLNIAVQCRDHLLIEGPIELATTDGQLNERWAKARVRAFDPSEVRTVVTLRTEKIAGAYQADLVSDQCLLALQFNMKFSPNGFAGTILKTVASAACEAVQGTTGVSPRPGGSWETP